MIDAFPAPSWTLLGYSIAAVVMVSFNIWVFLQFFPRSEGAPTISRATLVGYVLVSSMALWISVLFEVQTASSQIGATAVLFGVQAMMIAPFAWAVVTILRGSEYYVSRYSWGWPILLAFVMPGNELLMGAVWVGLQGGWSALVPADPWWWAQAISASVGTVFFFWSMFANMVPLLYWVPLPRGERTALLGLAATALIGPWVVSDLVVGAVLMGALMTATFLLLLRELSSAALPSHEQLWTYAGVAVAFFTMAAAEVVQLSFASAPWAALPFALVMLGTMFAEMVFLSRRVLAALPLSPRERKELAEWQLEVEQDEASPEAGLHPSLGSP